MSTTSGTVKREPLRRAPLAGARSNVGLFGRVVPFLTAETATLFNNSCVSGAFMTDDNRTRPHFGGTRAGYGSAAGPRYQPSSLVTSRSAEAARSARSMPRTGGSGKKEILCAIGVDVDAVAGWLGSYGGENSPCDISRGLFAGEIGVPRLVNLFDRLGIPTSWFIPGHSIETFPDAVQDGGRCRT